MVHAPIPAPAPWPPHRTDRRDGFDRRVNQPERRKAPGTPDRRRGERRES